MSYTGRTGSGGAYRLVYTVDGRGGLRISVVLAGPTGALHREGWECPVPQAPLSAGVALGYPGRVVPSEVDKRCHQLARSPPVSRLVAGIAPRPERNHARVERRRISFSASITQNVMLDAASTTSRSAAARGSVDRSPWNGAR
jgi:hypothetical protein